MKPTIDIESVDMKSRKMNFSWSLDSDVIHISSEGRHICDAVAMETQEDVQRVADEMTSEIDNEIMKKLVEVR